MASTLRAKAATSSHPKPRHSNRGLKQRWAAVRDFASDFSDDDPLELAAATSYYTLLSLAPLLLIVIGAAGLIFDRATVQGRILDEMRSLIGEHGAKAVETVILNITGPESGLSIGVGLVALLIGASAVLQQLSSALNKIWGVEADPKRAGWRGFVRKRLLSYAMVLAMGFLLLVSLVVSAALSSMGEWWGSTGEEVAFVWQVINALASFLVLTLLFALMFKFLPDAKISWRHVWVGAAETALLFTIGKQLIGAYLGHASIGSSFGTAGSVVVFTVWVYYASLIVFLGAKITHVHSRQAGARVVPEKFAEPRSAKC